MSRVRRPEDSGGSGRMSAEAQDRVEELFGRYLEARAEGRDLREELLAECGPGTEQLESLIDETRRLDLAVEQLEELERPTSGWRLGRFEVLETLGETQLSRVYRARDPQMAREVALKVLDPGLQTSEQAWILNEARSLASAHDPGVVEVFEVCAVEGRTCIVMELLPGPSLEQVIRELRRTPEERAAEPAAPRLRQTAERLRSFKARIRCLAGLAEALARCHDLGILHRDIKPANVLFDLQGQAKLIDFGLAHMEGADEDSRTNLTQSLVGTAAYTAPEQVENAQTGADPLSDQFSLGTVAYELCALENPFLRKGRRATLDAVVRCQPRPLRERAPAVPPDLARVVHHALQLAPSDRYPGMSALALDLRNVEADRPISVTDPSLLHLTRLFVRRHRRGALLSATLVGLGLLTTVLLWLLSTHARHEELLARLARIRPEAFSRQSEFDSSFQPLFDLQNDAREFDSGFLRRLLWGAKQGPVMERCLAWSHALGDCFEKKLAAGRAAAIAPQLGIFPRLFELDSILCPDDERNLQARQRGTVLFPEDQLAGLEVCLGHQTYRDVHPEAAYYFHEVERVPVLAPGTYRLLAWKPGSEELWLQGDFFVPAGWPEAVRVELHRPRREWLERCRAVPAQDIPLPWAADRPELLSLSIPAFRLLPGWVTWEEFCRFVQETGHQSLAIPRNEYRSSSLHPDDPAWVDFTSAMAFANWVGGRLPSKYELRSAWKLGLVEQPGPSELGAGEFVIEPSGLETADETGWVRFADPEGPVSLASRSKLTRDSQFWPVCFRVAFYDDRPETHRELEQDPFKRR